MMILKKYPIKKRLKLVEWDNKTPHHQTFEQRTIIIIDYFNYKVRDAKGRRQPDTPGVAYYQFTRMHGREISRYFMSMQVELFNAMMNHYDIQNAE